MFINSYAGIKAVKTVSAACFMALMVNLLTCPSLASDETSPCEQYIHFVEPRDSPVGNFEDVFMKKEVHKSNLQFWTPVDKQTCCDVFRKIDTQAPALLERACNGRKLDLMLGIDRSNLAKATPQGIECRVDLFMGIPVYPIIMHELVHVVDCNNLSTSLEWNKLIAPNLRSFRAKYKTFSKPFVGTVDLCAVPFGLPSGYAATDPTEALAECTTAMVIANWNPPTGIRSFIQNNILSKPRDKDRERELLSDVARNMEKSDFQKAIASNTEVLRLDNDSIPAWSYLALIWGCMDEPELAEFCARQSLQRLEHNGVPAYAPLSKYCFTGPAIAYSNYSEHYRELGQCREAVSYCTKAIELDPKCDAAYDNRGLAYDCLKQYRRSISDYNKAISLAPKCGAAYGNRGLAYDCLKQYRRSISDYNKAISLNPKQWLGYFLRGNIHEKLGDNKKAIEDYNKAIQLNPHCVQAYNQRAAIYKKLGNRGK